MALALPRYGCSALAALIIAAAAATPSPAPAEQDPWPSLRAEIYADRPIAEHDGQVALFAPERAEDAAIVPISIRFPASVVPKLSAMKIIIDRNPAPVAATFTFGDGFRTGDVGERMLATRIRVDFFSRVRVVLETTDGQLHMASQFVAGSGGCSSPGPKDIDQAIASLGQIRIATNHAALRGENWREAQVMIRHPSYTGLQRDPATGELTPARFVSDLEVTSAGASLFRMEGGIAISENPHLRFTYAAAPQDVIEVRAADTEGASFHARSAAQGS